MWIRAEIRFRAKTIVTSLSRDIHVLIMDFQQRSSCLGIRGLKMEGVPTKILGKDTLQGHKTV